MMLGSGLKLCKFCTSGYHAPFERFERLAVIEDGPAFLNRCKLCGALWNESLHSATLISPSEAVALYPGVVV